jgi:hypothetical protein
MGKFLARRRFLMGISRESEAQRRRDDDREGELTQRRAHELTRSAVAAKVNAHARWISAINWAFKLQRKSENWVLSYVSRMREVSMIGFLRRATIILLFSYDAGPQCMVIPWSGRRAQGGLSISRVFSLQRAQSRQRAGG